MTSETLIDGQAGAAVEQRRRYHRLADRYQQPSVKREDSDPRPAPCTSMARRVREIEQQAMFGKRMYWARNNLNGWTQQHAAKLFGYANSSTLAKIEQGGRFPLWMPAEAAGIYGVTVDFLMGVTDDEFEMEDQATRWHRSIAANAHAALMAAFRDHAKQMKSTADATHVNVYSVARLIASSRSVKAAMDRVAALNGSDWEEIRGGAKLAMEVESMVNAAKEAERIANRARMQIAARCNDSGIMSDMQACLQLSDGGF